EYSDPFDRRFHAQPIACPRCGPQFMLTSNGTTITEHRRVIAEAADRLLDGQILAIKGIGGYQLACDARNVEAVRTLRKRKVRQERSFAVMVKDMATVREVADVSPEAQALLESKARPIVLV